MNLGKYLPGIGVTLLVNLVQLAAGCILALFLLWLLSRTEARRHNARLDGAPWIPIFAVLGVLLPAGTFGAFPIAVVLIAAAAAYPAALALLVGNFLFNMLVPSTDPAFTWRYCFGRPIFALGAGLLAGFLALAVRSRGERLFAGFHAGKASSAGRAGGTFASQAASLARLALPRAGIFLVCGAVVDAVFKSAVQGRVIGFIMGNPMTSAVPMFFSERNVTNPLFLLAIGVLVAFMDLARLAGVFAPLRLRGMIAFTVYLAALACLLGLTAFLPAS